MAKKLPTLIDPSFFLDDLVFNALSLHVQAVVMKLFALADTAGGYVRANDRALDVQGIALILRVDRADVEAALADARALIGQDGDGYYIHELKRKAELRDKRRRAGRKGGNPALVEVRDAQGDLPLEKRADKRLVKQNDKQTKSRRYSGVYAARQAKKSPTPLKIKNIFYYPFSGADAEPATPDMAWAMNEGIADANEHWWRVHEVIKLRRGEYEAMKRLCPWIADFDNFLEQQDAYLAGRDASAQAQWKNILIGYLRKGNAMHRSAQERQAA